MSCLRLQSILATGSSRRRLGDTLQGTNIILHKILIMLTFSFHQLLRLDNYRIGFLTWSHRPECSFNKLRIWHYGTRTPYLFPIPTCMSTNFPKNLLLHIGFHGEWYQLYCHYVIVRMCMWQHRMIVDFFLRCCDSNKILQWRLWRLKNIY